MLGHLRGCAKEFSFNVIAATANDALIPPVHLTAENSRLSPSLSRSGQDPQRSMEAPCPAQDSSPNQQDRPPGGHQGSRAQCPPGYPFALDPIPESQPGSSPQFHQCSPLPEVLLSLLPGSCHESLAPHPMPLTWALLTWPVTREQDSGKIKRKITARSVSLMTFS